MCNILSHIPRINDI
jgi:hypothetical protein